MAPPALIPAAGRGTRLHPVTRYVPKPLLPVGEQPVLAYALREALGAGCRPVVVVVPSEEPRLGEYLHEAFGTDPVRAVEQPRPRGLADALVRGYGALDSSPDRTAMLLPDNVVPEGSGVEPLLNAEAPSDRLVFGVVQVSRREAKYFGNSGGFDGKKQQDGSYRITGLQPKGEGTFRTAGSRWPRPRTVGRTLLPEEFFRRARRTAPDPGTGEVDDVPVYREMLQSQPALGVPLPADLYDMGQPDRYLRLCARVHRARTDPAAGDVSRGPASPTTSTEDRP